MHVLFLTKWYPGRNDPQLGEFIRKQAQAVSAFATTSVIFAHPVSEQTQPILVDRSLNDGLLELKAYYRQDKSSNPLVRRVKNLIMLRKAFRQAFQELIKERGHPDINHVHILTRPLLAAIQLKRKHGIPFVVSEQSSVYLDGTFQRKPWLHRALDRWGMKKAAKLTAVSPYLSEAMRNLGLGRKFAIVPNVLPLDKYPVAPAGTPGHFLMVADLVDKIKNVSGVLYAVESIAKDHPSVRLDIIGDGVDGEKLRALAEELRLGDHVRFLGRLPNEEVLSHMAKVACVVINSRVETFSVVTGEALMFGKPVVATRCGGPIDLVNTNNGILVPVGDRGALENAMVEVMLKPEKFDPQLVRDSVSQQTSSASIGQAFLKIYEEVLA